MKEEYLKLMNDFGASCSTAYQKANARYHEKENKKKLMAISNQAVGDYSMVADITTITIQKHMSSDLLVPGTFEQIMRAGGVNVTASGTPIFRLVVRRATMNAACISRAWGKAFQTALDRTCYSNGYQRLVLCGVKSLPGGYVELALTWGCW